MLIVRRKKRLKQQQEIAMQNSQMQSQMNAQSAQAASQAKAQEEQVKAQLEAQKMQLESQMKAQMLQLEYQLKMELEKVKGQYMISQQQIESGVRKNMESFKEDRKDERVKKQAVEQSKLISQRKGDRGEIQEEQPDIISEILGS